MGLPVIPSNLGHTEMLVLAGSHAYGLATETSDEDYRGFFTEPIEATLGLRNRKDSWVGHDPDCQMHETKKFLNLALRANPTILETLAIPAYLATPFALDLRTNFDAFLSDRIRNTYGGYARQQFHRLEVREGTFNSDLGKRTQKHARHLYRLLEQGQQLLATGKLEVRVKDREAVFAFGLLPWDEMGAAIADKFEEFDATPSVLPPEPNSDLINQIVVDHRLSLARGDS